MTKHTRKGMDTGTRKRRSKAARQGKGAPTGKAFGKASRGAVEPPKAAPGRVRPGKRPIARQSGFKDAPEAFAAWQSGTALGAIAKERGLRRRIVKLAFLELAGGKEGFDELRAQGAGGRAFGGKRSTGRKPKVETLPDDSKVKVIHSSSRWKYRRNYRPIVVNVKDMNGKGQHGRMGWRELMYTVWIAPSGNEYVDAEEMEPADLVVKFKNLPGTVRRMRRYEKSKLFLKHKAQEELVKRGQQAQKVKKKQKVRHKKLIAKHTKKK